jgi:Na+/H+-dicarboxylate symporter
VLAGLLAVISTLAVVGLPGQVSFFASNAPAAIALGAPIELLPLLLAIDTVPDTIRTVANVTADMAAAVLVAARTPTEMSSHSSSSTRLPNATAIPVAINAASSTITLPGPTRRISTTRSRRRLT